jgi:ATP-dependent helicase/nuclease subunit B
MPSPVTLATICQQRLLDEKWLIAPSHRAGHQWVETLVRSGQAVVNLRPTTTLRLALDLVGPELAERSLSVASRALGPLIIESAWSRLQEGRYLSRFEPSPDLASMVCDSLRALRLAGCRAETIRESDFESADKARDIIVLLEAYEKFHRAHALVDDADILRRAIGRVAAEPELRDRQRLILVPEAFHATGLERKFLDTLPDSWRVEIEHPAYVAKASGSNVETVASDRSPSAESFTFGRAVGEVNELRELLRCALDEGWPLDDIEVLYTDADTYVPLICGLARRYASEPKRPEGVPVTFAEGIPATESRPGRALAVWLYWARNGYPQRLFVQMIGEGLINCGDDKELTFRYLMRLLRPIAIGLGAENYSVKLQAQLDSLRNAAPRRPPDDEPEDRSAWLARKMKGLKALKRASEQLIELSRRTSSQSSTAAFQAAEKFLVEHTWAVSELDRVARDSLVADLKERRMWIDRLGVDVDAASYLATLPGRTRLVSSGPRPGHLHAAPITTGGQSGRRRTIVVGLDDRRFPGAVVQDPVLLDHERLKVNSQLSTSTQHMRRKLDDTTAIVKRLAGSVTLSWPCRDLTDDRELFPSSFLLSAYRWARDGRLADLETLDAAAGPPASFAPATSRRALDEAEQWLWWLSAHRVQAADQMQVIEPFFAHLQRGNAARAQRQAEFGPCNGFVPRAGADLNPLVADGPVLSASGLETAGRCPLAYFFRYALQLYPPDEFELDPDRWLDAAQFGLLLHDVFRQFLSELTDRGLRPQFDRDHGRLAEILQAAVQQWRIAFVPPNENAFRNQYWQLVRSCRIFLQAEEEFCESSEPRFFEAALGVSQVGKGSQLDCPTPTVVSLDAERTIRAKGQIDRVDKLGDLTYSVWDYKISSGYGYDVNDPLRQGRRVQNVLYVQMVESALRDKLDDAAKVARFGYFFPSTRALGQRLSWPAKLLEPGLEVIARLCNTIAAGSFPATDDVDDCKFCDYRMICRDVGAVTDESRQLLGSADQAALDHFRELRHGK